MSPSMAWFMVVAALAGETIPAESEPPKVAVLPVQSDPYAAERLPPLIDEYLLTAVQSTCGCRVVGQDDINLILGYEQRRSLADCGEAACLAEIGGALGVDKLVSAKFARLGSEWVVTTKLINIRATSVEARSNDFVPGDGAALLKAVPALVHKLFAGGGIAAQSLPALPVDPRPRSLSALAPDALNELCLSGAADACARSRSLGALGRIGRRQRGWGLAWMLASIAAGLGGLALDSANGDDSMMPVPFYLVIIGQGLVGGSVLVSAGQRRLARAEELAATVRKN